MRFFSGGFTQFYIVWRTGCKDYKWAVYYEVLPGFDRESEIKTPATLVTQEPPEYIVCGTKVYELTTINVMPRVDTSHFRSGTSASYSYAGIHTQILSSLYYPVRYTGSGWIAPANSTDNTFMWHFLRDRNLFKITLDMQGGSFDASAASDASALDFKQVGTNWEAANVMFGRPLDIFMPPEPVRANADFLGWYSDAAGETPLDFSGETMPAAPLIAFAKWLVDPVDVRFYSDPAGTNEIAGLAQRLENGGFATDPGVLDPEDWGREEGDDFLGWYVKLKSGMLVPYNFGMPVTADLSLYARWDPPYTAYHLEYDLDGGSGTGGAIKPVDLLKYASGVLATVEDETSFEKGGMVFVGWKKDAESTLLHGGNKVLIKDDTKLTAAYAPESNIVTIKFNPNGGNGTAAPWVSVRMALATWPDATDLKFTRAGHTFLGWSETKSAAKADSKYAPLSSSRTNADLTLYAVWKANPAPPEPPAPPAVPPGPLVTPPPSVEPPEPPVEPPVVPPGPPVVPPGVDQPGVEPPIVPPTVNPPSPPPVNPPVDLPAEQPINPPVSPPVTQASTPQEVLGQIMESGMPSMNVGGMSIPLAAGTGLHHLVWALVNLILAIAGAVLVIAAILRSRGQKNREEEYVGSGYISELKEHEGHNGDVSIMSHGDIIETSPLCPEDEEREQENKRRPGWLAILTVMGIVGVIVFILTEDMTRLMVLVDNWTIVNAIIFIIALISYRYAFKREKEDEYEEEEAMA